MVLSKIAKNYEVFKFLGSMRVGLFPSLNPAPAFPKSHYGSVDISHPRHSFKRITHGLNRDMHPSCLATTDPDSWTVSTHFHQRRRVLEVAFAIFVSINIPLASASTVTHPSSRREVRFIFPQAERLVAIGEHLFAPPFLILPAQARPSFALIYSCVNSLQEICMATSQQHETL